MTVILKIWRKGQNNLRNVNFKPGPHWHAALTLYYQPYKVFIDLFSKYFRPLPSENRIVLHLPAPALPKLGDVHGTCFVQCNVTTLEQKPLRAFCCHVKAESTCVWAHKHPSLPLISIPVMEYAAKIILCGFKPLSFGTGLLQQHHWIQSNWYIDL